MMYTFELTQEDLLIINRALLDAPYRHAAPLIDKINQQIAEQENVGRDKSQTEG